MAESSLSLKRELEQLVREHIHAFKKSDELGNGEILEFHLRHHRIMELYRLLERASPIQKKGWLERGTERVFSRPT